MTLKKLALGTLTAAAALAFVIGSTGVSEAKRHTKKPAAAAAQPVCVWMYQPVCAKKFGKPTTYANACFAANDGATGAKAGACKGAKKGGGKKAMKGGGKKKKG